MSKRHTGTFLNHLQDQIAFTQFKVISSFERQQHVEWIRGTDKELDTYLKEMEKEIKELRDEHASLKDSADRFDTIKAILDGEDYKEEEQE